MREIEIEPDDPRYILLKIEKARRYWQLIEEIDAAALQDAAKMFDLNPAYFWRRLELAALRREIDRLAAATKAYIEKGG